MAEQKTKTQPSADLKNRNDLVPEIAFEIVPIGSLKPSAKTVRKQSAQQVAKHVSSIEAFGFVAPLLATRNGEVIDGHSRLTAAKQLGIEEVPVIWIDHLDAREVRALRIAVNRIQETGEWDEGALKLELAYQLEFKTDLTLLGFEPPELDALLEISSGEVDAPDPADEVGDLPAPGSPAVSEPGDVWELGDHLIYCGNIRDVDMVADLFGSSAIDLVLTDPPFNVPVKGHVRVKAEKFEEFAEASGEMSEEEFVNFLSTFIVVANQHRKLGALYYAFMDWRHAHEMLEAIRDTGFELVNLCVWAKPNGGMGSFYRSRHELVFVFREPGVSHLNNIELGKNGRYRTNVWEYAGATGGKADAEDDFSLHPTVKPIRLVADAILDSTVPGNTVFDPFLGSGTTLLAAERTKRRCVGIELAPAYVDVAIRRWEEMTGREAVLRETGQSFAARASGLTTGTATGTAIGISEEDFG